MGKVSISMRRVLWLLLVILLMGIGHAAYQYYTPFSITDTTGGGITGWVGYLTLDTASLITAGKMRVDCADIDVQDSLGNPLPFWVEKETCNTVDTRIWVKADIPAGGSVEVRVYYGDPSVTTSRSSGTSIFDQFFDDFSGTSLDTSKWKIDGGSPTLTNINGIPGHPNGYKHLVVTGDRLHTITAISGNALVAIKFFTDSDSGSGFEWEVGINNMNDGGVGWVYAILQSYNGRIYKTNQGSSTRTVDSTTERLLIERYIPSSSTSTLDGTVEYNYGGETVTKAHKVPSNAGHINFHTLGSGKTIYVSFVGIASGVVMSNSDPTISRGGEVAVNPTIIPVTITAVNLSSIKYTPESFSFLDLRNSMTYSAGSTWTYTVTGSEYYPENLTFYPQSSSASVQVCQPGYCENFTFTGGGTHKVTFRLNSTTSLNITILNGAFYAANYLGFECGSTSFSTGINSILQGVECFRQVETSPEGIYSFNATLTLENGTILEYQTTNGSITTSLTNNDSILFNVTVSAPGLGSVTYTGLNTTLNTSIQAELYHSRIRFNATDIITGSNVSILFPQGWLYDYPGKTYLVVPIARYMDEYYQSNNSLAENTTISLKSYTENLTLYRLVNSEYGSMRFNLSWNATAGGYFFASGVTSIDTDTCTLTSYYNCSLETVKYSHYAGPVNISDAPAYTDRSFYLAGYRNQPLASQTVMSKTSISLSAYSEADNSSISSVTFYVDNAETNTTYTTGMRVLDGIAPGTEIITATKAGWSSRTYTFKYDGYYPYPTYSIYLLPANTSYYTVFKIQDFYTRQPLPNTAISIERLTSNGWLLVESGYTDVTGSKQVWYETGALYRYTISRDGYETKQFTLTPSLPTYYILLSPSTNNSMREDTTIIKYEPTLINTSTNTITLTITNPDGQLYNYSVEAWYNGARIAVEDGNNSYGGVINLHVNLTSNAYLNTLILKTEYHLLDGNTGFWQKTISVYSTSKQAPELGAGLGSVEKLVIASIITLLTSAGISSIAGSIAGGLIGLGSLAFFTSIGFIPYPLTVLITLILVIIIAWRLSL